MMLHIRRVTPAIVVVLTLVGCTLTRGSSVLVGTAHPPIDPSGVKLYLDVPKKYEKVALLSADSRNDFASQQNLTNAAIDRLKKEAAKVGANGILLNGIGNYQIGASGVVVANPASPIGTAVVNTRTGKEATGLAIYVIEEQYALQTVLPNSVGRADENRKRRGSRRSPPERQEYKEALFDDSQRRSMGYFANLYLANLSAIPDGIEIRTEVYGSPIGERAYFSFGEGVRPLGLHVYGEGVVSNLKLDLLPGYPLVEKSKDTDALLFTTSFDPRVGDDPVLYQYLQPPGFIPRRDRLPLEQPNIPFVTQSADRLSVIYSTVGRSTFRFWIERLASGTSLAAYDFEKLLHPEQRRYAKVEFEFGFPGVFKVKAGTAQVFNL